MKTFKQILRETWSTPPDAPQHSAYYTSAPKSRSKIDFKTGAYTPHELKPKGHITPTGDYVETQTLHTADDYPAFDSREKAVNFMTRQLARVGNVDSKVSPEKFNPEREHAGAVVKLKTDGSYKWGVTQITKDQGGFSASYKIDKDLPGEVTDALHNHPQSKHDFKQRSVAHYHSTADTGIPFSIAKHQEEGKPASDSDDSAKYANPLEFSDPDKRYRQELVYPNKTGRGWKASSYDAVRDARTNLSVSSDDGRGTTVGAPKQTFKNVSTGEDMGDIKPEEPVAKAYPYKDYNSSTAHDDHTFEYSGKELYAANKGRKLGECMVASFLNKRKTGVN